MRHASLALFAMVAACGGDDGANVDASPSTQHITGTISYEDRAQKTLAGRAFLAPAAPAPARRVEVAVFAEEADEPLAMTVADDTGAYSLDYLAVPGAMVHVTVIAESTETLHPIKIVNDDGTVHAFGGAPFAAGSETANLLVTIASMEAEAFNVFDMMQTGFDKLQEIVADPAPPPLTVRWYPDNLAPKTTTHFTRFNNTIDLEGYASDDDGFDDTVMLHEFGHYVSFNEARDDTPGGNHDGTPADPRLAWSEGWATYWEMVVFNAPLYIDTSASGGFVDDDDTEVEKAKLTDPLDQDVTEGMVTQILWDLGDADAGAGLADDDPYAGTHPANVLVLKSYLKSATLRTAGQSGVDLVDFLDGWFIANGLTGCAAVRTIVQTAHEFPYDFAGPGGSCP